jgi:hypothetical protein
LYRTPAGQAEFIICNHTIEEGFLDDKSGGFQLERSRLRNSEVLSRLCLILAIATIYLVSTGVSLVTLGLRALVDAHWFRELSYFKLGWRWLKHAITNQKALLRFAYLDPFPDPQPPISSWPQFSRPSLTLYSINSSL